MDSVEYMNIFCDTAHVSPCVKKFMRVKGYVFISLMIRIDKTIIIRLRKSNANNSNRSRKQNCRSSFDSLVIVNSTKLCRKPNYIKFEKKSNLFPCQRYNLGFST